MININTRRLQLLQHSAEAIRRWQNDRRDFEIFLGLQPHGLQLEPWALHELEKAFAPWLHSIETHPDDAFWYSGWSIVLREANVAVGGIGCAGPPDANGEIVVGYHVDLRYRGQGIASEALEALAEWAFSREDVRSVVATIPEWNTPSIRVAQKCRFVEDGRRMDEDMEVMVWRRRRE